MKLSYYYDSCKKENSIKTSAPDRYAFLQEYGEYDFKERCTHCGFITKKSINRLNAEPNKHILIGGVILGVIVGLFLYQYRVFSFLAITIPFGIWLDQNKKTALFNRSRVK